jgi:hypothetical protein
MLDSLYEEIKELRKSQEKQIELCNIRFKCLEHYKRRDTTLSALFGIVGGFVAMAVYYLKNLLSGK